MDKWNVNIIKIDKIILGSEFTQYIIDAVIGEKDEKFFDGFF